MTVLPKPATMATKEAVLSSLTLATAPPILASSAMPLPKPAFLTAAPTSSAKPSAPMIPA